MNGKEKDKIKAMFATALFMTIIGIIVGYAFLGHLKSKGRLNGSPSIMGIAIVFALTGALLGYTKYSQNPDIEQPKA